MKRPEENREVVRWILEHLPPDGTLLDVGGNVGKISEAVLSERPLAAVLLFEPLPKLAEKARARLRPWPNVRIYPVGLSDRAGTAPIYTDPDNPGWSTLDSAFAAGKTVTRVELARLDDYGFDDLDVVKLDCEFWEGKVLKGGRRTIDRCLPVIVSELSRGSEDLWYERVGEMERLFDLGYQRIDYRVTNRINVLFEPPTEEARS
ncbi:MAG TPA: FkbM family methyltransferase [Phycisphaerae bacterium]|nr:FkbM family methyltransferase [Phycisphaerae bacterium]